MANDGGFGGAEPSPVGPAKVWTLSSSGPERLPRTVYVRFAGGTAGAETYQDDIILDETVPAIATAALQPADDGSTLLRLEARDDTSGVAQMQVTEDVAVPGPLRPYATEVQVPGRPAQVSVRVIDTAGNASEWATARPDRVDPAPTADPAPPSPGDPPDAPVPPVLTDTTAPVAALSGRRTQRAGGTIRLVVRPNEAVRATLSGRVRIRGAAKALPLKGIRNRLVAGGSRATLELTVPKRTRTAVTRALRKRRKVVANLRLSVRDAAGNVTVERRTIRLVAR